MKKKSRTDVLLAMFTDRDTTLSCDDVTKHIIAAEGLTDKDNRARYLSGSISSKLAAMVKKGTLKYADTKTARGGHLYKKVFKQ